MQKHVSIETLKKRDVLFKAGDVDDSAVYLLDGHVELAPADGDKKIILAEDSEASYALAQLKPRQYTGKALTDVTIARIDSDKLERLLSFDQASDDWISTDGYEVAEFGGDGDTDLLVSMLNQDTFSQLPVENISDLFSRLEPVSVKAGDVVIAQGKAGDYYYLVKSGELNVCRKLADGKVQMLATLSDGDVFGEEALISDKPRNASVIAKSDCELMRLSKSDFDELLKPSLVRLVSQAETEKLLKSGASLIDVRTLDEFKRGALRVAINIPLSHLRRSIDKLDHQRKYVLCCQTGARSSVGAFLLNQRGFEVYILEGGLQRLVSTPGK